jgi:hypothetical protein
MTGGSVAIKFDDDAGKIFPDKKDKRKVIHYRQ